MSPARTATPAEMCGVCEKVDGMRIVQVRKAGPPEIIQELFWLCARCADEIFHDDSAEAHL